MTVQVGWDPSSLSIAKRNVIQVRAGNAYAKGWARHLAKWRPLVELWHIKQKDTDYLADLTALMARRFLDKYQFNEATVGQFSLTVYPFYAGQIAKDTQISYNLIPSLQTMADNVGKAMARLTPRWVFNSYACGDAILCLDAAGTKYLYSDTHGDGSQDNKLAAVFSEGALETAIDTMGALMDHTGKNQIGGDPDVILLNPSLKTKAMKALFVGLGMMEGLASTSAATTRPARSIFSIRPIFDAGIPATMFALVDTEADKKPFIFNVPDVGDGTEMRRGVKIKQDIGKTKDWWVWADMDCGRIATEVWFNVLASASEGGFGTLMAPENDPTDL